MYRKKAFPTYMANYAVHLYDIRFWMFSQILLKVSIASANTAAPVNFKL